MVGEGHAPDLAARHVRRPAEHPRPAELAVDEHVHDPVRLLQQRVDRPKDNLVRLQEEGRTIGESEGGDGVRNGKRMGGVERQKGRSARVSCDLLRSDRTKTDTIQPEVCLNMASE